MLPKACTETSNTGTLVKHEAGTCSRNLFEFLNKDDINFGCSATDIC